MRKLGVYDPYSVSSKYYTPWFDFASNFPIDHSMGTIYNSLNKYLTKGYYMRTNNNLKVRLKRALWTFLLSYISVTIVATAFSFLIIAVTHAPRVPESQAVYSHAYILSEYFQPAINLINWTLFAGLYFWKRPQERTYPNALRLGVLWLPIALVVDLVFFVLIQNPISLGPHDFYIGQFPWIYLIYIAVFISPSVYVMLQKMISNK